MTRTALVLGVANKRSIAWACIESLLEKDFKIVFTYQSDRFAKTAENLISSKSSTASLVAVSCNVEHEIPELFDQRLTKILGESAKIDAVIHSVAYAPPDAMKDGTLLGTSRESFLKAHDISSYSFLELARYATPWMRHGASLTTLSYLGAVRAIPNYNVMGPAKASLESLVRGLAIELPDFRVNAISSGPLNTLAARGINRFSDIRSEVEERSPLRKLVTPEDVAKTIRFVATEADGITGQTIYVDGGYSVVAGPPFLNEMQG
mmetsp:Transcript_6714/g.10620  ORF Transcript_6714/g.10620 Transcript_6714/m.10620 type:complete len:264 (+) Transcript_6714:59-850(+)